MFSFLVHVHRFGIYGEQESDMWQGYEGTLGAAAIHAFLSKTSTDICPSLHSKGTLFDDPVLLCKRRPHHPSKKHERLPRLPPRGKGAAYSCH